MFRKILFIAFLFLFLFLFPKKSFAACALDNGLPDKRIIPKDWETIHLKISSPSLDPSIKYKIKWNDKFLRKENYGGSDAEYEYRPGEPIDIGNVTSRGLVNPQRNVEKGKFDKDGEIYTIQVVNAKHTDDIRCNSLTLRVKTLTQNKTDECDISPVDNFSSTGDPNKIDSLSYKKNIQIKVNWKKSQSTTEKYQVDIKRIVDKNGSAGSYQYSDSDQKKWCPTGGELTSGWSLPPDNDPDPNDPTTLPENANTVSVSDLYPGDYSIEIKDKCGGKTTLCSNLIHINDDDEVGNIAPNKTLATPEPVCPNNICNTALGSVEASDPTKLIAFLFSYILSFAGIIAFLILILAGYRLMTSAGDKQKVAGARETITSAIIGLLVIIFSLVIFQLIGVDLLNLPGLGR